MKAKLILTILAVVSLFGSTGALAHHPQGCTTLTPADPFSQDRCPEPPNDDEPKELSGCAYTAFADVNAPVVGNVAIPNQTPVNFTDMSGASASPALRAPCPLYGPTKAEDESLGFATPAGSPVGAGISVLRSTVDAEPAWFPSGGYSLSSATTTKVSLSVPLASLSITADVIRAVAYCTGRARGPGRDDIGPAGFGAATIAGLTISHPSLSGGSLTLNALPPEDTWIPLPGVGGIMLRETWDLEMPPAPGNPYKSFTENMIHVYLTGVVTGDIVISQAHCDGYELEGQAPEEEPKR